MAKAIDSSTADIHVGYMIEGTAGEKPVAFIGIPNPKSIPDFNLEVGIYDVTFLSDTEWKRYIEGSKNVGGALLITFGMSQVFLDMWEDIRDKYEATITSDKRMWLVFYHPRLSKSFFLTCALTRMGWAAPDADSVWGTSVSVTPAGDIGWATVIKPKAAVIAG